MLTKLVRPNTAGILHRDAVLERVIDGYQYAGALAVGVVLPYDYSVVKDASTGLYWRYTGAPYTITSTDLSNANWVCVGLLTGHDLGDARNFGFVDGMANAAPVLTAMLRSTYTRMHFPYGSTINLGSRITLRSDLNINFNRSTINWTGAAFTKAIATANPSGIRDNCVLHTPDYSASYTPLYNIHLRKFTLKGNNVGVGVNLRNASDCTLSDFTIEACQVEGVNISNAHRCSLSRFTIKDCAALKSQAYTVDMLEAWSDGIIIWFGCTDINISAGTINQSSNTRCGRGGLVIDGYKPDGQTRETSCISVDSTYVYGYDRPVHTELCGVVNFEACEFEYSSSDGRAFIHAAAVVWNVLEKTTFLNCRFITDRSLVKTAGIKASFIDCVMIKRGTTDPLFVSGPEETGVAEFTRCNINFAGGAVGAWNCSFYFDRCSLSSDAATTFDCGGENLPQTLSFTDCKMYNIKINGSTLKRYSVIRCANLDMTGVSAADVVINAGSGANLLLTNLNSVGKVTQTGGDYMRITGLEPPLTVKPWHDNININGEWLAAGKPTGGRPDGSGDWARGDRIRVYDAIENAVWGYQCVTAGSPGRWSALGTLPVAS